MQGIQREECAQCGKSLVGVVGSRLSCPVCKTPHTFSEPEAVEEEEDEPTWEPAPEAGPNDPVVVRRRA